MKLAELMTVGRPPEYPVAWLEERLIEWTEFRARVANLSHAPTAHPEREWLPACAEPLDFAVALFAVWHAGCRALLPSSLREGAIIEARRQAEGVLLPRQWRYPGALPYNERGKLAAADMLRQFETTATRHE